MIPPSGPTFFRGVLVVLVLASAYTFAPLWAPLALAAWTAHMARPLLVRVASMLGGKNRAAGLLVAGLLVVILVPLILAGASLVRGAADLVQGVGKSADARDALREIVSGGQPADVGAFLEPKRIAELVEEHGRDAATLLGGIFGVAAKVLLGLFMFVYAVFVFLVDGPQQWRWAIEHAPLDAEKMRRFGAAFHETGRGLFVGIGLTGLAQGLVATGAYVALGVPRAFVLGLLTCICSLIPSVGTAIVWVPVAAGLAVSGRTGAAIAMGVVGLGAVSTIDNLLRPFFARFGKLELSAFVLLASIFGGLAVFGAWGLFAGPLLARLAKEALLIAKREPA